MVYNKREIKKSNLNLIYKDFIRNKQVYIMAIPILVYYIIFCYIPMYGVTIAFKDFSIKHGILGSPWAGLKYFKDFFSSYYCWRVIRNTLLINIYDLIWAFPAPIILALLLNELRAKRFKRVVQTVSYLPHFVSMVVVCGIIKDFTSTQGVLNTLLGYFSVKPTNLLVREELFRTIFISSGIWQDVGWGSIIYLAALSGIDLQLYEASTIDGAGRWAQARHITFPGIAPTIVILLILRLGSMMSVGFEKVILLYSPIIYETSDVISTFVYRKGLLDYDYSYSTAVGLFNSLINFFLLMVANWLSRKYSEISLW